MRTVIVNGDALTVQDVIDVSRGDARDALRETLRYNLVREGYHVLEAATGPDALDVARAERPDLILLDVRLPDGNGLELARELKANPATEGVPVIAVSASVLPADRAAALLIDLGIAAAAEVGSATGHRAVAIVHRTTCRSAAVGSDRDAHEL